MAPMGAKTKTDIETDRLAAAAGKASQTLAASAPQPIPPPPPTATSALDAALALVTTSSETLRTTVDATDTQWATGQSGRLAAGPPVIQQQDTENAGEYQRTPTFPMPAVKPPIGPPDVTGIRPA